MSEIYKKLVEPKVVKYCILAALLVFLPFLVLGLIFAYAYGGTVIGPGEYNILNNWISDLGSYRFTPTPFFLDYGAMITSFLLIPVFLYLRESFKEAPLKKEGTSTKMVENLATLFLFIGLVGLFGIGLFSEDRSTALELHELFSAVVFGGFAIGALFGGIVIIKKETLLPEQSGYFMIIGPPAATTIFVIDYFFRFMSISFLEWVMLWCIFIWMIPFSLLVIKELNEKIA